ncbi:hypothetical protein SAMN04488098_104722 [Alkalibacterium thalassium]|uniref:Uncharacterized protein n=1 Tax=Alkalibacterium thalassium TaxID=426701 RepID=A0A1G9DPA1_9LACT|nr:hypothetical protein SAMN04488098_104722 [Alkalibacterium thalassium]
MYALIPRLKPWAFTLDSSVKGTIMKDEMKRNDRSFLHYKVFELVLRRFL